MSFHNKFYSNHKLAIVAQQIGCCLQHNKNYTCKEMVAQDVAPIS